MTALPNSLEEAISGRTTHVGIVGLGYVGLPTMVALAQAGFKVTGLDIAQERADRINAGDSYVEDVSSYTLGTLVSENKITATTDYAAMVDMHVVIICVPTPVNRNKEPVLVPLQEAAHSLASNMRGEQLVVLQSTSFPGTTEELVLPILQGDGRKVGQDFYLAFSPERIDPGNKDYFVHNIPKVVGGVTPKCGDMAAAFFSTFVEKVVPVSSPKVAEMTKLLENIFRSVNIALVNELSEVCQRMGIDIWEVIRGATTKPFGFMPFYPGVGVGGHCIPVDPFYLSWKAKEYDLYVNFIELAARTNDNRPYYAVSRILEILGDRGKTPKDSNLLLLGISFKKDIGDTRNSPALRVGDLLAERGAQVSYHDLHVPQVTIGGRLMESVELDKDNLGKYDAAIIMVGHSYYDLDAILLHSKLVIDTLDATRALGPLPNIVKL